MLDGTTAVSADFLIWSFGVKLLLAKLEVVREPIQYGCHTYEM